MIPRKLSILDSDRIKTHLKSLGAEDRRLRFGMIVRDEYIDEYVENSFKSESKWFGVDHIDGHLVATCHAAIVDGLAELGCSVSEEYRGEGFAQLMFARAVTWLRTKGITDVCMHCLSENGAMKHIARKNDMVVVSEQGETDANVKLEPADLLAHIADAYADRMAVYDMMLKSQIKFFRSVYA